MTAPGAVMALLLAIFDGGGIPDAGPPPESLGPSLRAQFLGATGAQGAAPIGRVAVMLIERDRSRVVGVHQPFHTGDQFRFQVSSNRDGYLYLLHRGPSGEVKQLWPRPDHRKDANRISAGQPQLVPAQGQLMFNQEIGLEDFYIVLRAAPVPPRYRPRAANPRRSRPRKDARAPGQQIVNFAVDGVDDEPSRGVVYVPAPQEADPGLFFSALPQDARDVAAVELQLGHQP